MSERRSKGTRAARSEPGRKEDPPAGGLPESPSCPFCEGSETELVNAFGAHASVSTYWCRPCGSPFEFMRWGRR